MCDMYGVLKDGQMHLCETGGELRAFLEPVGGDDDECCLCNLDGEATAVKAGGTCRRATDEEGWPWPTWIIELPEVE